ncbi:hypothetical protein AC578_9331 [Pseudocercospora eumusae]|uniref:Uncharacterized protein n=1 Tax=Pseudocercospora eumusae TaxID=321146 RepID=A0A139HNF4_9PEZI|nr:hypothetical protein AC578_9331 [Pseudocercospora eumusae]
MAVKTVNSAPGWRRWSSSLCDHHGLMAARVVQPLLHVLMHVTSNQSIGSQLFLAYWTVDMTKRSPGARQPAVGPQVQEPGGSENSDLTIPWSANLEI